MDFRVSCLLGSHEHLSSYSTEVKSFNTVFQKPLFSAYDTLSTSKCETRIRAFLTLYGSPRQKIIVTALKVDSRRTLLLARDVVKKRVSWYRLFSQSLNHNYKHHIINLHKYFFIINI